MGAFDNVDACPRITMVLFFIVDTSGSMAGEKIGSLNVAAQEVISDEIRHISEENTTAQIKIAVMEFATGTEWMYPEPIEVEKFQWKDLEAGGITTLGEAYNELNNKLSTTTGFMKEASGSFAPAIILMSDGEPTDNWEINLEKLRKNNWFKAAIKTAIAIGDGANQEILAKFTGNEEMVLTVNNKTQLKKIIEIVSVHASKVASSHASVGKDAPESKQDEAAEKIKEVIENTPETNGVEIGTEVTKGNDEWLSVKF